MNELKEILKDKTGIPDERLDELLSIGRQRKVTNGTYFLEAGTVPGKFGFVVQGLFRYVYITDKGIEFTKGIISENNFISSYSAMISNTPSYFFIEALEDSEILEISFSKWQELQNSHPFWDKFLIRLVEMGFAIKEKRERDLLLLDAETRYKNFLNEFPGMDKRIKQQIIASYLGVQPESLSRIKQKLSS